MRAPQPISQVPEPAHAAPVSDARQRGGELYLRMCAVCHGARGEGEKADHAPAIGGSDFLAAVSDDFLRRAIVSGRLGTPMSPWSTSLGGPLTGADVDAVIAFLRSLGSTPPVQLDERPLSGELVHGSVLYTRECQRCHGVRGVRGSDLWIGNPQLLVGASDGFLRDAIGRGRAGTRMPGFRATLGEQGIEDLVAYLRNLQQSAPVSDPPAHPPPPLKLGSVPVHPRGPEPMGFQVFPGMTSVAQVHGQLARGARMALLDARAPSDYLAGHIASAVSVPFYDPGPYLAALPKDAWLVCYCGCPHAESSELALKLMAAGFSKVTVLQEGLPEWASRGFGMHRGEKP